MPEAVSTELSQDPRPVGTFELGTGRIDKPYR